MEKEIEASLTFWNEAYKGLKSQKIEDKDLVCPTEMEEVFTRFLKDKKVIVDYGCGEGTMLMLASLNSSSLEKAYGIEKGENIVKFASAMMVDNNMNKVTILDGGLDALDQFEDESIDGIIISNVIDVMEEVVANQIASKVFKKLKKGGDLLLKVNPYFTTEQYLKMGFDNIRDNLFAKNGVLRSRQVSDEYLRDWLKKDYEEIGYCLVPWQSDKILDRMFLWKKK